MVFWLLILSHNESITDSKKTNNGRWIVLSSSTRPHSHTVQPICHICVSKLTIIGSQNGLLPGRCQAIIWTNAGILLIWPFQTNFSEISIDIQTFSFKKIYFKMSSGKWRPFCPGINVLNAMYSIKTSRARAERCPNVVLATYLRVTLHMLAEPGKQDGRARKGKRISLVDMIAWHNQCLNQLHIMFALAPVNESW